MAITRSLTVAAMALSVCACAGFAQSDTAKVIEQLEEELNSAFNQYDAPALARLWDDDLAFVSPNGALTTKTQRLEGLKSRPPNIPVSTNESVTVRLYGDIAVANVVSRWTGTNDGKSLVTRFRATHVWTRRSGSWRLVAAHVSQMPG